MNEHEINKSWAQPMPISQNVPDEKPEPYESDMYYYPFGKEWADLIDEMVAVEQAAKENNQSFSANLHHALRIFIVLIAFPFYVGVAVIAIKSNHRYISALMIIVALIVAFCAIVDINLRVEENTTLWIVIKSATRPPSNEKDKRGDES